MPIINSKLTKRILDEKECFDLWVELGTLEKVRQVMYDRGLRHPLTGKSVTPFGIRTAAFRYMLDNLEVAYERMNSSFRILSREEFDKWAVYKALTLFQTEVAFGDWLKNQGWYDDKRYLEVYDNKYPKLHTRGDKNSGEG
jgi:hypothetical protein